MGTNGGLVSFKEGKKITDWKNRCAILKNRVDKIVEDKNGYLWLATRGNGIFIFDKKKSDVTNRPPIFKTRYATLRNLALSSA